MIHRLARSIHSLIAAFLLIFCFACLSACQIPAAKEAKPQIAPGTPDSAEAYLVRGDQYAGRKQYVLAIEDYNQAIKLKPDYAEAYNNRGYSYYYGSDANLDQAIADYSKAIELRPDYAYAYNNRGAAFMANGFPDKAISDLNQALQLKSGFPQAYSNRGNTYLRKGQIILAISDFAQGNIIAPYLMVILVVILLVILLLILRFIYRRNSRQRNKVTR